MGLRGEMWKCGVVNGIKKEMWKCGVVNGIKKGNVGVWSCEWDYEEVWSCEWDEEGKCGSVVL